MNGTEPRSPSEKAIERKAHPFYMWDGIEAGPEIVRGCLAGEVAEAAACVGPELKSRGIKRAYLLGCGTSYFAGMAIAAALAELVGIDADAYNGFEFGRYKVNSIEPKSAVIAVSHTGGTRVDVEAIEAAKLRGAMTVCLTDVSDSPLARAADFIVPGVGGMDPAIPKTRSYLASMVKGYVVAAHASPDRDVTDKALDELNQLPDLLSEMEALVPVLKLLGESSTGYERIVVVGGGPNAQTAMEVALKFKEAALMPAEGLEIEESIHGPEVMLDEKTLLITLSTSGPSLGKIRDLCRAAQVIGAPVLNMTTVPDDIGGRDMTTVELMAPGIREYFTPPILAYPMQMMVYWMALARGINPDLKRTDVPKYRKAIDIVMPPGSH
jgi:glucosamine--fructose-6-phosphate aminotransferase (isomerizing)